VLICVVIADSQQKVLLLVLAAVIGGAVSLLVNLVTQVLLPRLRRWNLTRKVSIITDPPHDGNARFRIVNGGYWTIGDAILYLQLDFEEADTLPPTPDLQVHIAPGRFAPLSGDQLCWSVSPNPMKVNILAKERQPFSPCKILPGGILIPAEGGWPPAVVRVLLRHRVYTGRLRLVSADTDARNFRVRIDPNSHDTPCTITPTVESFDDT
jgi:hypothetical protein